MSITAAAGDGIRDEEPHESGTVILISHHPVHLTLGGKIVHTEWLQSPRKLPIRCACENCMPLPKRKEIEHG